MDRNPVDEEGGDRGEGMAVLRPLRNALSVSRRFLLGAGWGREGVRANIPCMAIVVWTIEDGEWGEGAVDEEGATAKNG